MSQSHTCPSCGHKWRPGHTRGRPKTAYYEARGQRRHLDDWAADLGVSVTTLRYWMPRFPGDFERVVNLLDKDRE